MRLDSILLRSAGRPVLIDRLYGDALISRLVRPQEGLLQRAMKAVGLAAAAPSRDGARAASAMGPIVVWAADPIYCPGFTLVDSTAVIDVKDVLTQEGYYDWWGDCWVGGYDGIGAAIRSARADDRVKAILLRIASPGGLVEGLFELCADIREGSARNGGKPIWAHCSMATSAAYAIAASCDRVLALATAYVANIGVYMLHSDYSAALKEYGLAITEIVNDDGDHKTDFNDYKPLSEGALADARANVNEMMRLFRECVMAGRGISEADIRAQKSRAYLAQHADSTRSGFALKLVDEIATEPVAANELQMIAAAAARTPDDPANSEETDVNKAKLATIIKDAKLTDAQKLAHLQTALAEGGDGETEEERKAREAEEAKKQAEKSDVDKQSDAGAVKRQQDGFAVLDLPEAKGRGDLAKALGRKVAAGAMTLIEAKEMLMAAPKSSRLDGHMTGRDINVGPGNDDAPDAAADLGAAVDTLVAKRNGGRAR